MYSSESSKQRRGSSFMDKSNEGSGPAMPRGEECLSALQFGTVRSTSSSTGYTVDCLLTTSTRESWRSGSKSPSDENPEEVLCTFETPVNLDSLFIAVENDKKSTQVPSKIDVYVATGTDGWSLSGSVNFKDASPTPDFPNHLCTRKITACLDVTKVLLRLYCSKGGGSDNGAGGQSSHHNAPFSITHLKAFGKPSLGGGGQGATFLHNSSEELGGPVPRHHLNHFSHRMMQHQYDDGRMNTQHHEPLFRQNMGMNIQQQPFQLGGSYHLHPERQHSLQFISNFPQQPPRQLAALPPTNRAQSDPGAGGDYISQPHGHYPQQQNMRHLHHQQRHHHQQQLPASASHVPRAYLRPDIRLQPGGRAELAPIQKSRPYSDDGAGYRHHHVGGGGQQTSDLRERTMDLLRGHQQQQQQKYVQQPDGNHQQQQHRLRESPQETVISHSNESTGSDHQSIRTAEKCYSILIQKKARALEADDLDVAERLHDLLSRAVSLRAQISDLEMRKRHAVGVDDYRTAKECKSRISSAVLQVEALLEEITKPQPLEVINHRHPAGSHHTGEDGLSLYNPTSEMGDASSRSARDPVASSSPPSSIGPSISVVVQNEDRSPLPSPGRQQQVPPLSPPRSLPITPRRVVESPNPAPLSSRMSVCGSEQRHQAPPSEIRSRAPKADQQHPKTHQHNDEQSAVVPVLKPRMIDVVTVDIEHVDTLEDVPPPIFAGKSIQSLTSPKNQPNMNRSLPNQRAEEKVLHQQKNQDNDDKGEIGILKPSIVAIDARPFLTHLRKRIVIPEPVSDEDETPIGVVSPSDDQSDPNKEYTLIVTPVNQHNTPVPTFPTHCWNSKDPMMVFIYAYLVEFCTADSSELSAEKMIEESLAGVVNSGGDAGDDTKTATAADRALVRSSHLVVEVSSLTGWNLIEFTFGVEGASCLFTRVHPKVREAAVMSLLDGDVVTSILSNGACRGITDQTFQEALIFYISGHNNGFGVLDPVATIFLANMQHFSMLRHLQSNKHLSPSKKNLKVLVGSLAGRMGEANTRLRTVASAELIKSAEMILPEGLRGGDADSSSSDSEGDVPKLDPLTGANVLESVAFAVAVDQHPEGDKNKTPLTNANFAINRLTTITSLIEVFLNYCYADRDAQLTHGSDSVFRAIQSPLRNGPNKLQLPLSSPRLLPPGLDAIFENYFPSLYPPLLLTNLITPLINHRTESVRKAAVVLLAKVWSMYVVYPHIQKSVQPSKKSASTTPPPPRSQSAIESIVKGLKPAQKKQFDALVKEASENLTSSDEEDDDHLTPPSGKKKIDDDVGEDWGIKAAPVARKLPPPLNAQSLGNKGIGGSSSSIYSSSAISNLNFTQNAKGGFMEQIHKTDTQIDMEMRAYAKAKRKTIEETLIENPDLAEDFYFGIGKDVVALKNKKGKDGPAKRAEEQEQEVPPSPPPFTNEISLPLKQEEDEEQSEQARLMKQRRQSVRNTKVISSQPLGHHESISNPNSAIGSPLISARVGGNNDGDIEVAPFHHHDQHPDDKDGVERITPLHISNISKPALPQHPPAKISVPLVGGGGLHRSDSNIRRERIIRELEAELNLGSPLAPHYSESPESCKVKKQSAYSDAVNPLPPRRSAPALIPGQCQYCGIKDQEFNTRPGLEDHFKYECVLLTPCPLCMKSVEIRDIHAHMTHDCTLRGRVRQCPKCLEAVASSNFVSHVNENTCAKFQVDVIKCALCSVVVPDTEAAWRDHLAGVNPCRENPRSVLTDDNLVPTSPNSSIQMFEAEEKEATITTVPVASCSNSPISPSLSDSSRKKKNVSFGDEIKEVLIKPTKTSNVTDDAAAVRIQALHRGRMARRALRGVVKTPPPQLSSSNTQPSGIYENDTLAPPGEGAAGGLYRGSISYLDFSIAENSNNKELY